MPFRGQAGHGNVKNSSKSYRREDWHFKKQKKAWPLYISPAPRLATAVIHMTHCPIFWLLEERQADFFLLFPPFIENRFIIYSDYGFPYPPLFFPAPLHLPDHLDPLPFCLPLENERLLRGNKIWHNKSTLELDKTTKQKGKSPREGTRNRDLLVCIQNHLKTLDWKPYCMCREPGIDLCRPYAYCFVICEFRYAMIGLIYGALFTWCSPSPPRPQRSLHPVGRKSMETFL